MKKRNVILGIALSLGVFGAIAKSIAAPADPFAGDTWHAVGKSWPGTIVFDGKKKSVVLTPMGAKTIAATYSFTITSTGDPMTGELTFKDSVGTQKVALYELKDKKHLSLNFKGLPQVETYVRMTQQEEAAETERIKKLVMEKKLEPIGLKN